MLGNELYMNRETINSKKNKDIGLILGSARSGTTMLVKILKNHPKIACTPELHFFDFAIAGRLFSNWEGIIEKLYSTRSSKMLKKRNVSKDEFRKRVSEDNSYRNYFLTLAHISADKENYHTLVEKTPGNTYYFSFIKDILPEAKIIYILRDGREVCASASKKWNFEGNRCLHPAVQWVMSVRAYEKKTKKSEHLFLKYEDTVSKPNEELQKLFSYLGFSYQEKYVKDIGSNTSFSNSVKNGLSQSKNYHSFFSEKQRVMIEWALKPYLLHFGYKLEFKKSSPGLNAKILYTYYFVKIYIYIFMKKHGLFNIYKKFKLKKKK